MIATKTIVCTTPEQPLFSRGLVCMRRCGRIIFHLKIWLDGCGRLSSTKPFLQCLFHGTGHYPHGYLLQTSKCGRMDGYVESIDKHSSRSGTEWTPYTSQSTHPCIRTTPHPLCKRWGEKKTHPLFTTNNRAEVGRGDLGCSF